MVLSYIYYFHEVRYYGSALWAGVLALEKKYPAWGTASGLGGQMLRKKWEQKGNGGMEEKQEILKESGINLDKINEELLNVLSLLIVLESDMEAQKSDDVYLRLVRMVHEGIKNVRDSLPESNQE